MAAKQLPEVGAREYTREEMREACRNNYNAALAEFARRLAASQEPLEKRLRDAARLMIAYWSDRDDEPTESDLTLVRRMHRVLNGTPTCPTGAASLTGHSTNGIAE